MTLSHRTVFTEAPNPHISFCWGRMQPPHRGHMGVINTVKATAKAGAWAIFVTKTHDNKKNPLTYDQKVKWLYALYPETKDHLVVDPNIRTIMQAAVHLYDKGFRSATFVAGEDDMPQLRKLLEDYNGKQMDQGYYNFEPFSFMESPRILNATNARQAAKDGDPDAFERATQVPQNLTVDGKTLFQTVRLGLGLSEEPPQVQEGKSVPDVNYGIGSKPGQTFTIGDIYGKKNTKVPHAYLHSGKNKKRNKKLGIPEAASLSVEQLAHISDAALDDAYHYGLSTPGANFGWLANIESATAAKRMIDSGITDVEAIANAIHDGWNKTAMADYMGKLQLDTPTIGDKKKKRYALAQQTYAQLPEVEKEKDRVVARAMLQALGIVSEAPGIGGDWGDNPKLVKQGRAPNNPNVDDTYYGSTHGVDLDLYGLPKYKTNEDITDYTVFDIHREFFEEISKLDRKLFENSGEYESLQNLLTDYDSAKPVIGKKYIYVSISSTPVAKIMNIAKFNNAHTLIGIENNRYIFNINGSRKLYPETGSMQGDALQKVFLLDSTEYLGQMLTQLSLRFSDWKITFKELPENKINEAAEKNKIDEEMFRGEDGFIDMLEYAKFVVSYATGYDLYESIDIENLNYINSLHDEYSIKEPIIGKNYSAIFPMYVGKNTIQMFGHHAPLKLLSIDNDHYIFEKSKRYPIEYESVEGNGIFKTFILDPTMVSQLLAIMALRYNVKSHIVESAEKSTKATAKYQAMPRNGQRCDHCTMWRPPHGCSAVAGKIAPNGWCSYYKRSHRKDLDENMDHDKDSQAVEELKAALIARKDSLQGKDSDEVYKIIDKLMTSVAKAHGLTGQEIHDMWVEKYKEIPDTWIMNESQLDEAASPVLFHYTGSVGAALNILKNNEFALSISTGTVEAQYAPKGYNYFLSATRSKVGGYHQLVGDTAVMFNLDGNWFNKRYPVKAIDYWAGMHRGDRHSESEDRIFAREPSIPADAITAIHILLKKKGEYASPTTRQLMILAKKRGLPTYLYTDDTAWRLQDTRRALPVSAAKDILSGIKRTNFYVSSSNFGKRMLGPWLELIFKKKRSELSKKANDLRYSLTYWNGGQFSDDLGLRNEISNARKPGNSGYAEANKIIAAMRKIGASDVKDLLMFLHKKWDAEALQKESVEEHAGSIIGTVGGGNDYPDRQVAVFPWDRWVQPDTGSGEVSYIRKSRKFKKK
jgi:hypothetical protein